MNPLIPQAIFNLDMPKAKYPQDTFTQGHREKFNYEREPADETHVLLRTGPMCFSGLRQFFVVPTRCY
jgi:hypothetical protein